MKKLLVIFGVSTALILAGCNDDTKNPAPTVPPTESSQAAIAEQAALVNESSPAEMNHVTLGQLPNNLKKAANPQYAVGSKVKIKADHMAGMNGADATIVGAFDTVAYSVSYTPTKGGAKVSDHKWIIHEEIANAQAKPYKVGDKVTTSAAHMNGMENAEVTIDSVNPTTVYMVDYTDTKSGEPVKNHQWVTESELSK